MNNSTEWQKKVEASLQPVVNLAHTLLGVPLAIWLRKEPRSRELVICGSVNLPEDHPGLALSLGDKDAISGVPETLLVKIQPIKSQTEMLGAIGLFPVSEQLNNSDKLSPLIAVIATTVENLRDSYNSEKLAEIVREFNKAPSIEKAMLLVAKYARELTGANSSIIFLFDQDNQRFSMGARSPDLKWEARLPHPNGLTRLIIDRGAIYQCNDTEENTEECKRAENARGREKARSLIGIPLQLETEKLGVLYVRGQRPKQFSQQDVDILRVLADRISMALGWARSLLKPNVEVEQAISGLTDLAPLLTKICKQVKEQQEFDYAALQLVDIEERTIATVAGEYATHIPKGWTGVARHSLDAALKVRDIQADIASSNSPHIEIITGWDDRFDKWIYEEFKHKHYVRVYVPIVLLRNINGEINEDWFNEDWFYEIRRSHAETQKDDDSGYRFVIEVGLFDPQVVANTEFEVIGTLEAGYYVPAASFQQLKSKINYDQAIGLFRFAATQALAIHKKSLSYALEMVAKGAKQILKADSADLHFLFDERRGTEGGYVYQVCTGGECRRFLESHLPRYKDPDSLGQRAIRDEKPKFIPDPAEGHDESALAKFNPLAFKDGIKATVAFPLSVGDKHGVLYVHFRKTHWFNDDEIDWVKNFANRATTAIRHAINYKQIRDSADTLTNLHSVVQSLANRPGAEDLLRHIAGNTINILGADVVTVYEYSEIKGDFVPQNGNKKDSDFPVKVGRLFSEGVKITELDEHCGPRELVNWGKNHKDNIYYTPNTQEDQIMRHKGRKPRKDGHPFFVVREKFQSSLGILLKVGQEIVGAMFVHYRRPYTFPKEDRKVVEITASAAAIAIKNRRREVISEDFRKIITTPDLNELLKLIVRQAREITNANVGEIRLLEGSPTDQKLVSRALHPEAKHLPEWNSSKLTVGITGWVASNREARLVPDVDKEPDYIKFFSDLEVKSELCVPLLDQNKNVLGTLLVDSVVLEKFTERDKRVLQVLADQAVIGIQNAKRQEQLTFTLAITTSGLLALASPVLHEIKNDLGAINGLAGSLNNKLSYNDNVSEEIKRILQKVASLRSKVIQTLKELVKPEQQSADLSSVVGEVLEALKDILEYSNIQVINNIPGNLPEILGSKRVLGSIFANLIENSINHGKGNLLSIYAEKQEKYVVVRIEDNGTGITEDILHNLFTSQSPATEENSGFGLHFSRVYIKGLGGNIEIDNILQKVNETEVTIVGTKVTLMLRSK